MPEARSIVVSLKGGALLPFFRPRSVGFMIGQCGFLFAHCANVPPTFLRHLVDQRTGGRCPHTDSRSERPPSLLRLVVCSCAQSKVTLLSIGFQSYRPAIIIVGIVGCIKIRIVGIGIRNIFRLFFWFIVFRSPRAECYPMPPVDCLVCSRRPGLYPRGHLLSHPLAGRQS